MKFQVGDTVIIIGKINEAEEFEYRIHMGNGFNWVLEEDLLTPAEAMEKLARHSAPINTPCPSCGRPTLFIGTGGWITCSFIGCKGMQVGNKTETPPYPFTLKGRPVRAGDELSIVPLNNKPCKVMALLIGSLSGYSCFILVDGILKHESLTEGIFSWPDLTQKKVLVADYVRMDTKRGNKGYYEVRGQITEEEMKALPSGTWAKIEGTEKGI